ncbi:MAG: ATP-binding cassette domain-containing protein [Polynucleobacter sp.]|nr:ATP-binding cassette domain-containing protein [Polynucleobacter sp.]
MSADIAIQVEGVGKSYPLFAHPWHAVCYLASLIWRGTVPAFQSTGYGVQALSDIRFNVVKGERVGLVGRNGAGKSTLLKLLAGNFLPTTGRLAINGTVYCLFPGAVSFSFEQSTEENARQYLSYLGLTPMELQARVDEIREFTELGEYFYQPTKNLSLGMRVRAEFAVATAHSADVVIIDEVLGAGDIYWSEKIARRMEKMCASGTTLLLVSHSLSQVNRYCERAIWVERGCVLMDGPVLEVTKRYEGFLERLSWQTEDIDDKSVGLDGAAEEMGNEVLPDSGQTVTRWPSKGGVRITGVWLNGRALQRLELSQSDPLEIRLMMRAAEAGEYNLRYLLTLWDLNGKRMAVIENELDRFVVDDITEASDHVVTFTRVTSGLGVGRYHVTVTVTDTLAGLSTTNEHSIRVDVLYKSFEICVSDEKGDGAKPRPLYLLDLTTEVK